MNKLDNQLVYNAEQICGLLEQYTAVFPIFRHALGILQENQAICREVGVNAQCYAEPLEALLRETEARNRYMFEELEALARDYAEAMKTLVPQPPDTLPELHI